ncbi:NADH:ubiquinone oxidoreductase subunit ASHI [Oratosquilla oratoria]|uniref:NADH:ubiquinone oxidoreductase subunit ASHI n=1 Tax=Oratosquilla oratoria TaxID=337810 RepID=UPI003F7675FF
MAGIVRTVNKLKPLQRNRIVLTQIVRSGGTWNKDWKPSVKVPKTEEEKAAAAAKYGMLPQDYETFPEDGTGHGDYPNLPPVSADSRDPYGNYDFPEYRRYYGEPVHLHVDMLGMDRYDANFKPRFTGTQQLGAFFGVMTVLFAAYIYLEDKKFHWPVMKKQYPGDGQVHYTFEPAE